MKLILRVLVMAVAMATPVVKTQMHAQDPHSWTGERIMKHASGSFAVKIAPSESSAIGKEGGVGRMTIDKVISGDMVGTTKGEMLTSITESTGATAYVAIETVTRSEERRVGKECRSRWS